MLSTDIQGLKNKFALDENTLTGKCLSHYTYKHNSRGKSDEIFNILNYKL